MAILSKQSLVFFVVVVLVSFGVFLSHTNTETVTSDSVPIVGDEPVVFSLDAEIVGREGIDIEPVYLLEYRGNPNYRVLEYNSINQTLTEIFSVPRRSLVYSIELNPQKDILALAYTSDYAQDGNGVYLLDLHEDEPVLQSLVAESEYFYLDLEWSDDSSILATQSTGNTGDIVSIDAVSGDVELLIEKGIDPVTTDQGFAFLPLENDDSRRTVGIYTSHTLQTDYYEILDKEYDLDNLIYDPSSKDLLIAALNRGSGLTWNLGVDAYAHGNHSIPSSWVKVGDDEYDSVQDLSLPSILVYDVKLLPDGRLLEVTNEGLYISSNQKDRELLVRSRAFRFLTL